MAYKGTLRVSTKKEGIKTSGGKSFSTGRISSSLTDFTTSLYKQNVAKQDELIRQQVEEGLVTPEQEAKYWMDATTRSWLSPKQTLDFQELSRNALEDAQLARLEAKVETGELELEDLRSYYEEKLSGMVPDSSRALKIQDKIRSTDARIQARIQSEANDIKRMWSEKEAEIRNKITLGDATKTDLLGLFKAKKESLDPSDQNEILRVNAELKSLTDSIEKDFLTDLGRKAAYEASKLEGDDEAKLQTKISYLQKAVEFAQQAGDEDGLLKYGTQLNNAQTQYQEFQDKKYYAEEELNISQMTEGRTQEVQAKMDRTLALYQRAIERGDEVKANQLAAQYNNLQQSLNRAYEVEHNKGVSEQIKEVSQTQQLEADVFRSDMQLISSIPQADFRLAASIAVYKKYLFGAEPTEDDPEGWTGVRSIIQMYKDIYEQTGEQSLLNTIRDLQRQFESDAAKFEQVIVNQVSVFGSDSAATQEAMKALNEIEASDVYSNINKDTLQRLPGTMGILLETDKYGNSFEKPIKLNSKGVDPNTGEMYDFMVGINVAPINVDGQVRYIKLTPVVLEGEDPRYPSYYRGEYNGQVYIKRADDTVYDEGGQFKVLPSVSEMNTMANEGDRNARNNIKEFMNESVITEQDLYSGEGFGETPSASGSGTNVPVSGTPTGVQTDITQKEESTSQLTTPTGSSPFEKTGIKIDLNDPSLAPLSNTKSVNSNKGFTQVPGSGVTVTQDVNKGNQVSNVGQENKDKSGSLNKSGVKIDLSKINKEFEVEQQKQKQQRQANLDRFNVVKQAQAVPEFTKTIVAPKIQQVFTPAVDKAKQAANTVTGWFSRLFK